MARRAWGTGALYKRKRDGRWVGRVPVSDGHRFVTGTDRDEVSKRLTALRREVRSSTSPATDETLAEWLDRWLADIAIGKVRERTWRGYRRIVTIHIAPAIGDVPLVSLRPEDVQHLIGLTLAKRSPQTARNVHGCLRSALSDALRFGLVERNVARLVPQPRVPRSTLRPLDLEDARKLIAGPDDELHALYVLAITTGMRLGEMQALRWQDIDLERGTVTIGASLRRLDEHRWVRDEPKTARSRRTLTLPGVALAALERHHATFSHSATLLFTRPDGRPHDSATVLRRFKRTCRELGLREVTIHSLRHTAAALMLDGSGGDLRMVQSVLGHANISTTVDLYGGLAEQSRGRAAAVMDQLLKEATG